MVRDMRVYGSGISGLGLKGFGFRGEGLCQKIRVWVVRVGSRLKNEIRMTCACLTPALALGLDLLMFSLSGVLLLYTL